MGEVSVGVGTPARGVGTAWGRLSSAGGAVAGWVPDVAHEFKAACVSLSTGSSCHLGCAEPHMSAVCPMPAGVKRSLQSACLHLQPYLKTNS